MDEDEVIIDTREEQQPTEQQPTEQQPTEEKFVIPQKPRDHAVTAVRAAFASIIIAIAALILHEISQVAPGDDWKVLRTVLLALNVVIAILTLYYSYRISLDKALVACEDVTMQQSAPLEWVSSVVGGTKVTLRGSPPLVVVDHNPLVDELFGGKMLGHNLCDRIRDVPSKLAFLEFISKIESRQASGDDCSPITVVFTDRQMRRVPVMLDGCANKDVEWKEVSIIMRPTGPKTFTPRNNRNLDSQEEDNRAAKEKKRHKETKQAQATADSTTRSTSAQSDSAKRDNGKAGSSSKKPKKAESAAAAAAPVVVVIEETESPQDEDIGATVYPPLLIGGEYEIMDASGSWRRGMVDEVNEDQTYRCELVFGDTTSTYHKVLRGRIRDVVEAEKPKPASRSKYDAAEEKVEAPVNVGEAPVDSGEAYDAAEEKGDAPVNVGEAPVESGEAESEDCDKSPSYDAAEEKGEAPVNVGEAPVDSGEAESEDCDKSPPLERTNSSALCLKGHPIFPAPEHIRSRKCVMCMTDDVVWCCVEFDTCTFLLCISCNDKMDKIYKKQEEMQAKRKSSQSKEPSEAAQVHVSLPKKDKEVKQAVSPLVPAVRRAKEKSPQQPPKPARAQPPTNEISTWEGVDVSDRSDGLGSGMESLPDPDDLDDFDLEDEDPDVRFQARIRKAKENRRKKRALEKVKTKKVDLSAAATSSDPLKRPRRASAPVAIMMKNGKGDIDWGTAMRRIKEGEVGSYTTPRFSADEVQPANWDEPREATMWTYNPKDDQWMQESMMVQIMLTPFSSGGMRDCFKMRSVSRIGQQPLMNTPPMVAKVFKDASTISSEEYFNEAMTQMISEDFAKRFNKNTPKECNVTFIGVKVMRTERSPYSWNHHPRGSLFNIEPFLMGEYKKHSDNCGRIWESENSWLHTALPPAFSHFSYEESGLLLCVTDIQGVERWYTDPQIHSHDGCGFGMGNLGQMGVEKFIGSHVCNDLCLALKLSPLGCKDKAFLKRMENNRRARRLVLTTAIVDRTGKIVMRKWQRSTPGSVLDTIKDDPRDPKIKAKKKDRGGVIQQIKKSLIKK